MEQAAVVNANRGLFQSSTQIKEQYEEGMMGRMAGADWYVDQNVASHTTGARGGAAIVTTAGQTGSAINTSTWTASGLRLKAGDVIQFTGVYAVNPQTLQSTGRLRDFTVTSQRHRGCGRAGGRQHLAADYLGARPARDGEQCRRRQCADSVYGHGEYDV